MTSYFYKHKEDTVSETTHGRLQSVVQYKSHMMTYQKVRAEIKSVFKNLTWSTLCHS